MSEFVPTENGVPIRQPSTANLMIDSNDRSLTVYPFPWDFTIQKKNSILNGFFTRIGVAEVVLNWNIPNVQPTTTGVTFTVVRSGVTKTVTLGFPSVLSGNDTGGFYTVSEALDSICSLLNTAYTTAGLFVVSGTSGDPSLTFIGTSDSSNFTITPTSLSARLGFDATESAINIPAHQIVLPPNLLPTRYIDIVSQALTYNQSLKDGTTNAQNRDVLVRWYFAPDNVYQTVDKYGFPILQGYSPFYIRRLFNPAKQIRWMPNMPIGNLDFQVFLDNGALVSSIDQITADYVTEAIPVVANGGFLMTLQVSEV
jgi:hypothetical protein